MRSEQRHAGLWRVLRIGAATLLIATVGIGVAHAQGNSSAAESRNGARAARSTPSTPQPPQFTLGPGIRTTTPFLPAEVEGNGENLAGKAQTAVTLPPLQVFAYPTYTTSKPDPSYPGKGITRLTSAAWIISNPTQVTGQPSDHISYGSVPSVRVKTLAFGAIPISADLTLGQTVTDGYVDPIIVYTAAYNDADPNHPQHSNFTASGRLSLKLANVVVDGVALNLSSTCTTSSPVTLTAYATVDQYQVAFGGRLSGFVAIPSFTGCTADVAGHVENVDTLLTGALSGRSNPTYLTQNGLGTFNPYFTKDCYPLAPNGFQNGCLPEAASLPPLPTISASLPVPLPAATETFDPPAYG